MEDFDRSHERNWYKVHIGGIAQFVVRSYTEDGAKAKVDYWCEERPRLSFDSRSVGEIAIWCKPLDALEQEFYDHNGDAITPVRLVGFRNITNSHVQTSATQPPLPVDTPTLF